MSQARHYEMKDSGVEWIGKMPSNWQVKYLFQLASQVKNKNNDLREKNLLSLSYGKIKRKDIETTDGLLPASFDGYNIIEEGDIVMRLTDLQNDHTSLRVGRASERGIITSAYTTVRPSKETSPFLYLALHSFDVKKGFYGMGAGVRQGLNYGEVKKVLVPVPPLPEQTAIAAYLDEKCATIDAIIAEAKATIEEYKSWRASVISEAVTKGLNPDAEMKDSGVEWIGEIPKAWAVERLKAMFSFGKGLPITKEDLVEQGIPVISYGQIHAKFNTGVEVLPQLLRYVDAKWLESNANSLVYGGDFIFADTSEDMEGCGNCVYVDTLGEGAQLFAGYHTITFKPKHSRHNKFLAYLFKSDAWRTQLRSRVSGVKLFSISRRMLNLATVILPPTTEQEAIVAYLDSKCAAIDGVITEKESLIAELETYKKSLIFETVTGKRRVC